jgi:hypothetical protein
MENSYWLMSSETLALVRKLRKRVKAEFDIGLRLSDPGLVQQLARIKTKSVDIETQRLIARLEERQGAPFLAVADGPVRLYRGNRVLAEPSRKDIYEMIYGKDLALHDPSRRARLQLVRIYRGHRVLEA